MRDVLRFLTLRFLWLLATLWVVFTLSFVLMREVPGGPFLMEQQVDPVIQKQIEAAYDLDKTKWEQYVITLGKTVRGDLGPSFKMRDYTVNEILAEGMPRSVALGTLALLIALVLGIVAGTVSASRRGGFIDRGLMLVATIGIALPNFVIASILILVFVIQLSWLPAANSG